jgi:hypothetical protein
MYKEVKHCGWSSTLACDFSSGENLSSRVDLLLVGFDVLTNRSPVILDVIPCSAVESAPAGLSPSSLSKFHPSDLTLETLRDPQILGKSPVPTAQKLLVFRSNVSLPSKI